MRSPKGKHFKMMKNKQYDGGRLHCLCNEVNTILGGGGVQGQGKGQRLMSNIAVNDYIWLATCQGRIYEK